MPCTTAIEAPWEALASMPIKPWPSKRPRPAVEEEGADEGNDDPQ